MLKLLKLNTKPRYVRAIIIAAQDHKASSTRLSALVTAFYLLSLCFMFFAPAACLAETAQPTAEGSMARQATPSVILVSAARPFRNGITKEMAAVAADSALRIQASESSQPLLAGQSEVRAILGHEFAAGAELPELPVFAYLLLEPASAPTEEISGLPPTLALKLTGSFQVVPPERQRAALLQLLENKSLLTNLALAAEMEKTLLAAYDTAAADFLLLGIESPAQLPKQSPERPLAVRENGLPSVVEAALKNAGRSFEHLKGIRAYIRLLPTLYDESRLSASLLNDLSEANALLPDNYLLQSELGRLQLWLEQTGSAMETLNRAIMLNPGFSQAYSHRGTLLLLLHKPALALDDFNRAIELADDTAEFYYNRAVAWKALGDGASMCADLRQSCVLGQCAPYEWAYANGECREVR